MVVTVSGQGDNPRYFWQNIETSMVLKINHIDIVPYMNPANAKLFKA